MVHPHHSAVHFAIRSAHGRVLDLLVRRPQDRSLGTGFAMQQQHQWNDQACDQHNVPPRSLQQRKTDEHASQPDRRRQHHEAHGKKRHDPHQAAHQIPRVSPQGAGCKVHLPAHGLPQRHKHRNDQQEQCSSHQHRHPILQPIGIISRRPDRNIPCSSQTFRESLEQFRAPPRHSHDQQQPQKSQQRRFPPRPLCSQRAPQPESNKAKQQGQILEISKDPHLDRDPANERQFCK